MRTNTTLWARGVAAGLAVALTLSTVDAEVYAAPAGDFEQLIAQADEHADAGQHADALGAYVDAFEAMPAELRAGEVGEFVALAAAKAARADYQQRQDAESLVRGRAVVARFIELSTAAEPGAAPPMEAEAQLAELDAMMPAEPEPASARAPEHEPEPAPIAIVEPPDDRPPRRGLAIGLVAGGGAAALAGVGLMVAGVRQVPWYERQLEARGWQTSDVGYAEQIAAAQRVRNIDVGVGAGLVVLGMGLSVAGGVLLARGRRASSDAAGRERAGVRASIGPSFARDRVGLSAVVRWGGPRRP